MSQITGRVFITVNGQRLASKTGATLKFGGVQRNMVTGDSGTLGYTEETVAAGVDCTIAHDAKTSLTMIRAITNASGSFDTDSGRSYVLVGMVCLTALELTTGEVKISFGALDCKEV